MEHAHQTAEHEEQHRSELAVVGQAVYLLAPWYFEQNLYETALYFLPFLLLFIAFVPLVLLDCEADMGVGPEEEVGDCYEELEEGEDGEDPLLPSQFEGYFLGVGVVDHCCEVEHQQANEGGNCESPVHAVLDPFGGDGEGDVEESVLVVKVVVFLNFLGDGFLLAEQAHLLVPGGAPVDGLHDIGPGGSGEILEDVVLGEEEGLDGVIGVVDFDFNSEEVVFEQRYVLVHAFKIHVAFQGLVELLYWRFCL